MLKPMEARVPPTAADLPEDVRTVVEWSLRYDPRFGGDFLKAVVHFMRLGVQVERQLAAATQDPLDEDVRDALAKSQDDSLVSTLNE